MKPLFHLGNGAWCRLVRNFVIGVGLIAGGIPAFSAELSSHAYPPLLSAGATGDSSTPLVSDDGRFVVFVSAAENLTGNDGNHFMDVFLRDREAHTTILLSTNEAGVSSRLGHSGMPSMSADGRKIAFEFFATNSYVAAVTNLRVMFVDRAAGSSHLLGLDQTTGLTVSKIDPETGQTNELRFHYQSSGYPIVSPDGRYVNFIAPAGSDFPNEIWVHTADGGRRDPRPVRLYALLAVRYEVDTGNIIPVVADLGQRISDSLPLVFSSSLGPLVEPQISADSLVLAYSATIFGSSPTVAAYDTISASNIVISALPLGSTAIEKSFDPVISGDGRRIAFTETSVNIFGGDTNENSDIFLRDLETGITTLVSTNMSGTNASESGDSVTPTISQDGRWIAFFSNASDLVADDTNGATGDVFLRDNQTGVVTLISNHPDWHGRLASGAQAPQITSDGSFVLYQAPGSGLFLYDRSAGTSTRLTDDVTADSPSMSSDGRFVVFSSQTIPGPVGGTDAHRQIYLYDRELNSFELISRRDPGLSFASANEASRFEAGVVATADNLLLARSYATDLGLRADDRQLRLWNLANTSVRFAEDLGEIDGVAVEAAKAIHLNASADRRWLVFDYDEPALATVETNSGWHVVLHDRSTGENWVLNRTINEFPGPHFPAIAPDGSQVLWRPSAARLALFEMPTSSTTLLGSNELIRGAEEAPLFTEGGRFAVFRYRGGPIPGVASYPVPNWRLFLLDAARRTLARLDDVPEETIADTVEGVRSGPGRGVLAYETRRTDAGDQVVWHHYGLRDLVLGRNPYPTENVLAYESNELPDALAGLQDNDGAAEIFFIRAGMEERQLVTVNRFGTGTGNARSKLLGLSPDGRFVLFHSWANDLVANDTNQLGDLFLRDLRTQTTLTLTIGLNVATADGNSSARAMFNREGTKIIFESYAPNLVAGDFNETRDVYTATLSLPDSDGDGLPDSWELTWFGTLDRDGSGDFDHDGVTDHDEFVAGTNPTAETSVLEALTVRSSNSEQPEILWTAVPGRSYRVQYKDDFNVAGWTNLPGDVIASSSTGMRIDDSGTAGEERFYRVLILP